jgi:hypothetical protein
MQAHFQISQRHFSALIYDAIRRELYDRLTEIDEVAEVLRCCRQPDPLDIVEAWGPISRGSQEDRRRRRFAFRLVRCP